ncbi:hypothetical protein ACF0H5_023184 [Mactra antiquata]
MVKIGIIGAGVIGLSSALRIIETLPEAEVEVLADKFSPFTTTDVSGGFWEPHLLGDTPEVKIKEWSNKTFDHMVHLATTDCAKYTGACYVSGYQINDCINKQLPFWTEKVKNLRVMNEDELKQYDSTFGFFYTTVMLEPRLYLQWLMKRVQRKGGRLKKRKVDKIEDIVDDYDIIINCCGVGAQSFINDKTVKPVRGQVMRVIAPWIKHFFISVKEDEIGYILPSANFVVCGGTEYFDDWNSDADTKDRDTIWKTCVNYEPSLSEAKFDSDAVGFRPFRPSVRLEVEKVKIKDRNKPIIHNYGHGGSGVTLHWGCAEEVANMVKRMCDKQISSKL